MKTCRWDADAYTKSIFDDSILSQNGLSQNGYGVVTVLCPRAARGVSRLKIRNKAAHD